MACALQWWHLAEETLFRGLLLFGLIWLFRFRYGHALAVTAQAYLFMYLHIHKIRFDSYTISILSFALLLGVVTIRYRVLWPAIGFHCAINFFHIIASGNSSKWMPVFDGFITMRGHHASYRATGMVLLLLDAMAIFYRMRNRRLAAARRRAVLNLTAQIVAAKL